MEKKNVSKSVIVVFTAFLFVIGLLYIVLPKSTFSQAEKRELAQLPQFSFASLADGSYTKSFERFLSDQTPLRKFFVSVNAYFELAKGNNGSNGVYLGSDGWLIEKPFDRENRFSKNMLGIVNFSRKVGLPAAMVVVPEKGSVYSEYLPKNSLKYEDSKYMQRIEKLTAGKIDFVNLTDSFEKNKNSAQLFYKTDHHWTSAGAYLAYTQVCGKLGLTAAEKSSYNIERADGFYGTAYSTSCYTFTKPESVEIWRSKSTDGRAQVTLIDGTKSAEYDNMFFANELKNGDKYLAFLDGNHSITRIKTGNSGGRLLIIKDSFAHCLAPFLAENFSEIIMVDLRYYKKPVSQIVSDEKITQLMFVYGMENLAESRDLILR